jgi:ATP-dependent exoDNAse (exonuclease V) alpha subunit
LTTTDNPATGQRRFTDRAFSNTGYQSADLAYAITEHSAQGATVHTGIALVTGSENRQWPPNSPTWTPADVI